MRTSSSLIRVFSSWFGGPQTSGGGGGGNWKEISKADGAGGRTLRRDFETRRGQSLESSPPEEREEGLLLMMKVA